MKWSEVRQLYPNQYVKFEVLDYLTVDNKRVVDKDFIHKFKGISTKYLDNYLSWYNFLDSIGHDNTVNNIKEFLVKICLYQVNDTYDSIRTSKFSIV
ncbi:hypothetical protein [Natranaerofaba carboxydovora]|uniref:hypothetical protein n=1 Tax=Natranaerofaba carboxydovora TaxID=2742683 RepID=UPI001F1377F2|nr:hypothetical protein [Natranaerofaba carboxydovora]UMZ74073.1 hypothetical protein ACONDI_01646 [Natranaerofaba carboxydovora]